MDERLRLTEEQQQLAEKFNELCGEMSRAGIGFIMSLGNVRLLNLNNVEECTNDADLLLDESVDGELVDTEELPHANMEFYYISGSPDEYVGICYKDKLWGTTKNT